MKLGFRVIYKNQPATVIETKGQLFKGTSKIVLETDDNNIIPDVSVDDVALISVQKSLTKTIKKNKLTIKKGQIDYSSYDGFNISIPAQHNPDYERILEFIYNTADNNTIGNDLVVKFRKVLEDNGFMKPVESLF